MIKYLCPHCDTPVSQSKKNVSQGYFGACLECQEDFYRFELKQVQSDDDVLPFTAPSHCSRCQY